MPRKAKSCKMCGEGLCAGCGLGEEIHSAKYKQYDVYAPSPPSRLPSVADPSTLGISMRSGMPIQYHTGSSLETGNIYGGNVISKSPIYKALFGGKQKQDWETAKKIIKPIAKMGISAYAPEVAPLANVLIGNGMAGKTMGCGVAVMGGQRGIRRM
jgi:hypothetical protein